MVKKKTCMQNAKGHDEKENSQEKGGEKEIIFIKGLSYMAVYWIPSVLSQDFELAKSKRFILSEEKTEYVSFELVNTYTICLFPLDCMPHEDWDYTMSFLFIFLFWFLTEF